MNVSTNERTAGLKRFAQGAIAGIIIGCLVYFFFIASLFNLDERSFVRNIPQDGSETNNDNDSSIDVPSFEDFYQDPSHSSLIHVISELSQDHLTELITQSVEISNDRRSQDILELLLGQLARKNPQRAVDEIWKTPTSRWEDLIPVVFGEWSSSDFESALRASSSLKGWEQETATRAILNEQEDLSDESVMNLARSHGIESLVARCIQEIQVLKLLQEPSTAWNLILNDNVPDLTQTKSLDIVVREWMKEVGFEVLDHLYEDLYHTDFGVFEEILDSVTKTDFHRAFEFLTTMSVEKQNVIAPRLLGRWAEQNPDAAWQATARIVHGTTRRSARTNVMFGWAEKDPSSLLANVDALPRSMWRLAVGAAVPSLARTDPEKAAEHLVRLKPLVSSVDLITEFSLVEEWAKRDVIAAKNWVDQHAPEPNSRRSRLMQRVLTQYALTDTEAAIKLALAEEVNEADPFGAEAYVISALVSHGKMDLAFEMLPRVRTSARLSSTIEIAQGLLVLDRSDAAVELAQQLSLDERTDFFKRLAQFWFEVDLEELLNRLTTFPTDGTRAAVAKELLTRVEYTPGTRLTDAQLALLTAFTAGMESE